MHKKEKILALAILVILLGGELLGFAVFKTYSLFYQKPQLDELNHGLFSRLDANLGYAHDLNYKFTERDYKLGLFKELSDTDTSIQGFIQYKHLSAGSKPVRIGIFGDSTSDPLLFRGNWPWVLHQLLIQKNISHIIFNGSVSGYTSFQQLTKITRDLSAIEPLDLMLVANGCNDFATISDIVPGHPSVHVFQKMVFDQYAGIVNFGRSPNFLPNLQYLLKYSYARLFDKYENNMNMGPPVFDLSTAYRNNIISMHAIADSRHIKFFHFVQPVLNSDSQIDSSIYVENSDMRNPEMISHAKNDVKSAAAAVKDLSYSTSLANLLDNENNSFVDLGHLSPTGNKKVAETIFSIIEKNLKP